MALIYQDFQQLDDATASEAEPSEDYTKGFEDGLRHAMADRKTYELQLVERLIATLEDIDFTRAEAVTYFRKQIEVALRALLEVLLPFPDQDQYAERLIARLVSEIVGGPSLSIVIHGHPSDIACLDGGAFSDALPKADIRLVEDQSLTAEQFIIRQGDEEQFVDIAQLRSAIDEQLNAFLNTTMELANGR